VAREGIQKCNHGYTFEKRVPGMREYKEWEVMEVVSPSAADTQQTGQLFKDIRSGDRLTALGQGIGYLIQGFLLGKMIQFAKVLNKLAGTAHSLAVGIRQHRSRR